MIPICKNSTHHRLTYQLSLIKVELNDMVGQKHWSLSTSSVAAMYKFSNRWRSKRFSNIIDASTCQEAAQQSMVNDDGGYWLKAFLA